ncbi:MAG: hypothetical protein K2X35_06100 [Bryobacteraceae bacterium]|nr:hypothetical protein [Bryobacteraceae bacterium]
MTSRRAWLLLAILGGCARDAELQLPRQVGSWSLREGNVYRGPGEVKVVISRLDNSSAAFEAIQKWRPQPGRIAFQKDRFVVVLESDNLDPGGLNAFASQLEKSLR